MEFRLPGWRKTAVGVLVCVVLAAGAEIATAVTNDSPAVQPFQQGVYVGPADPSGVASFAGATQTDPVVASDFLSSNSGWDGMDGSGGELSSLLANGWTGSAYTLSLGVPMIPTLPSSAPGGTLAEGAAGLFDNYFVQLGLNLVAGGESTAYLRLGWEFDSGVYAWSATTPAEEADYVAYFRQIVTAMRNVPAKTSSSSGTPT